MGTQRLRSVDVASSRERIAVRARRNDAFAASLPSTVSALLQFEFQIARSGGKTVPSISDNGREEAELGGVRERCL